MLSWKDLTARANDVMRRGGSMGYNGVETMNTLHEEKVIVLTDRTIFFSRRRMVLKEHTHASIYIYIDYIIEVKP